MPRLRSALLFLALAAIWGTAFAAITAGLQYYPPVLFAALRYDIAGLVMLAYAALVVDDPIPRGRDQWTLVAVGSVLFIAAYHAFLFVGQQHELVTSAIAAVVVSLSPVLTTGFARGLLPDERLTVVGLAGLVLGFLGVVVIAQPEPDNLLRADVLATGFVFLAAVSFALGSVLTRRIDGGMRIETMEAWSMLGGAGILHLVSLALPTESLGDVAITAEGLAALGYLAVVASAIGFLIYFDLLDRLGPIEINLVSYVAPAFAALAGWLWLGEGLDALTVLGFCVILLGFLLIKRAAIREEVVRWRTRGR